MERIENRTFDELKPGDAAKTLSERSPTRTSSCSRSCPMTPIPPMRTRPLPRATCSTRWWHFVYRIGRELGSLAASLGGMDALVFTAGIGENAAEIRRRVCEDAAWLGVDLDEGANATGGPRITRANSRASAWVIPTDEDLMIARHAWTLMNAQAVSS